LTVIPESHRDILEKKGFAHVATIGPGGEPQSHPVWYDWDGEALLISATPTKQRIQNLRRFPRIAVSIQDPDDPYRYLEIRGPVEIEPDPRHHLIDALAKKYLGTERYEHEPPDSERLVVRIIPEHTTHQ